MTITSSSRACKSSLRSRSVVVGAAQTLRRSGPRARSLFLLFLGECARLLLHAPHELCFGRGKIAQPFFPLCLKPTSYESVFRLDRAILALCAFRFVASAFQRKTPLAQSCILVSFELLHGKLRGFDRRRCHRFEKCVRNGLIDLHAADGQTVTCLVLRRYLCRSSDSRAKRFCRV